MSSANGNNQMTTDFSALLANEIEVIMQKINSVDAKILRSQMEVDKLSKKNTLANSNIEKIQTIIDRASKDQIVQVYQNALDVYQRFLTMRSQMERLEIEKNILESQIVLLQKIKIAYENFASDIESISESSISTLETIIKSQEAERFNLARQMHDGPAQQMSNFILQTEIAMRFFSVDQNKVEEELNALKETAINTFEDIRDFIFRLRPMMLDDLGLLPTLKRFVDMINERNHQQITLNFTGTDRRYKNYIEIMVFRAIQELFDNAIKHSNANTITLNLDLSDMKIKLSVVDDGLGFDFDTLEQKDGVGILVLQDRVQMMNGEIEIDSKSGEGTSISITLPIEM